MSCNVEEVTGQVKNKSRIYRIEKFTEKQTEVVRVQLLRETNYCLSTIIVRVQLQETIVFAERETPATSAWLTCTQAVPSSVRGILNHASDTYSQDSLLIHINITQHLNSFVWHLSLWPLPNKLLIFQYC